MSRNISIWRGSIPPTNNIWIRESRTGEVLDTLIHSNGKWKTFSPIMSVSTLKWQDIPLNINIVIHFSISYPINIS